MRGGIAAILEHWPPAYGFPRPTWTLELLARVVEQAHLNPKIGPDWMLPGTQRVVVTPGNNEKRHLAGAYDPVHQRLVYVEGDRKASWLFLHLLRALRDAYNDVRVNQLILDNYIIHKRRVTRAWLREHGVRLRLHFLPPYCPNESRIERRWLDLHAHVPRNHQCPTMRDLMAAVHRYEPRRVLRRAHYVSTSASSLR